MDLLQQYAYFKNKKEAYKRKEEEEKRQEEAQKVLAQQSAAPYGFFSSANSSPGSHAAEKSPHASSSNDGLKLPEQTAQKPFCYHIDELARSTSWQDLLPEERARGIAMLTLLAQSGIDDEIFFAFEGNDAQNQAHERMATYVYTHAGSLTSTHHDPDTDPSPDDTLIRVLFTHVLHVSFNLNRAQLSEQSQALFDIGEEIVSMLPPCILVNMGGKVYDQLQNAYNNPKQFLIDCFYQIASIISFAYHAVVAVASGTIKAAHHVFYVLAGKLYMSPAEYTAYWDSWNTLVVGIKTGINESYDAATSYYTEHTLIEQSRDLLKMMGSGVSLYEDMAAGTMIVQGAYKSGVYLTEMTVVQKGIAQCKEIAAKIPNKVKSWKQSPSSSMTPVKSKECMQRMSEKKEVVVTDSTGTQHTMVVRENTPSGGSGMMTLPFYVGAPRAPPIGDIQVAFQMTKTPCNLVDGICTHKLSVFNYCHKLSKAAQVPGKSLGVLKDFKNLELINEKGYYLLLTKEAYAHDLERHCPIYWDHSIKNYQSFFGIYYDHNDVLDTLQQFVKEHKEKICKAMNQNPNAKKIDFIAKYNNFEYKMIIENNNIKTFFPYFKDAENIIP